MTCNACHHAPAQRGKDVCAPCEAKQQRWNEAARRGLPVVEMFPELPRVAPEKHGQKELFR